MDYTIFISILKKYYDVDIYIHTWIESEAKCSYRYVNRKKLEVVNNDRIYEYFKDHKENIKQIILEDDTKIELNGTLEGKVANSPMPIIGWKRM